MNAPERHRCEQCHEMKRISSDNPVKNPDWWFCDECRGQSQKVIVRDQFHDEDF